MHPNSLDNDPIPKVIPMIRLVTEGKKMKGVHKAASQTFSDL